MQWFLDWWYNLTTLQQVFACAALPATAILILQTLLLLFGIGGGPSADGDVDADADLDADFDTDFDGDSDFDLDNDYGVDAQHVAGIRIFTVRGLVAFFAVGGWLGIAMIDLNLNSALATAIAVTGGFAALFAVAYILKLFLSLQESGNVSIKNAVSQTGTVYITIPPERKGKGKVMVYFSERLMELDAVTDEKKPIKAGRQIKVTGLASDNTLIVSSFNLPQTSDETKSRENEREQVKV